MISRQLSTVMAEATKPNAPNNIHFIHYEKIIGVVLFIANQIIRTLDYDIYKLNMNLTSVGIQVLTMAYQGGCLGV